MNCSSLFCINHFFHYIAKKCEKNSPNYPRKQEKDRDGIVVLLYLPNSAPKTADISQFSKPKHRLRYK